MQTPKKRGELGETAVTQVWNEDAVQVLDSYDLIMALDESSDCDIDQLWETLWEKYQSGWTDEEVLAYEVTGQLRPVIVAVTESGWCMGNGHHRLIHNYALGRPTLAYFTTNGDYYVHGVSTKHYDPDLPDWLDRY